jgi:type III restriction enzyme
VTGTTQRLLEHWRHHEFVGPRPFFCQLEAVETIIWLTEVAPKRAASKGLLDQLGKGNEEANPALFRLALKMATGSGKTTVMAMLIAWQTVNAARKDSKDFSRAFLIITPGITIRDRLRALLPSEPDNYYKTREIVPPEMLPEGRRAEIVITNYHAFQHRETLALPKVARSFLQGNAPEPLKTTEKIINDLRRRTAQQREAESDTPDPFADFNGIEPDQRAEFYQHDQHWSNRMILCASPQVMAGLAEREAQRW